MSRKDQLANFTASLNSLYQEEVVQGVEMDWEWPLDTHDKKDKIKLIRYMRVSFDYGEGCINGRNHPFLSI